MIIVLPLSSIPSNHSLRNRIISFMKQKETFCGLMVGNFFKFGDSRLENELFSGDFTSLLLTRESLDDEALITTSCDSSVTIGGVFCHVVSGNLLFQLENQEELTKQFSEETLDQVVDHMFNHVMKKSSEKNGIPIKGVIGDYDICQTIVDKLVDQQVWKRDQLTLFEKENLYEFELSQMDPNISSQDPSHNPPLHSRVLVADDFEQVFDCLQGFEKDVGVSSSTRERALYVFNNTVTVGTFWGNELVSTARMNSTSDTHTTIGFVYTKPDKRRRGLGKMTFQFLFEECKRRQLTHVVLFTSLSSTANNFYTNLGFTHVGNIGLFEHA